ncbi:phage shock protein operon transcriptional activator [Sphingosinicella soli]|uniref:Psp operon transcriptional activator n=1 Tax=Sphingosinicella soli TaxID=333708 RepID=A0A7W7F6X0_9SPHN|nr:phage shock protein operon transcriptional activator [Sphingosinicella soli]MBB4632017.1 psp operon transcriptional activator [Sphingosinicella soli]
MKDSATLVGQSTQLLDAIERASLAAALNRPVLVIGERGTGKEMVAERLHRLSPRWEEPFIPMNCAAMSEALIDAELFGYEAGAFTGAVSTRRGRFEEADGGTLFLDEVGTLSSAAQERLLRVVEYGELTRLGANRPLSVDVRIVGATNEDLPGLVEKGRFRADLLDRLSFEVITLPPLRARSDDIMELANHFARRMSVELSWPDFPGFSREARQNLRAHDWPGNVRELKNVVERALYRWGDPSTPVDALQFDPFDSPWRPRGSIVAPDAAPKAVEAAATVAVAAAERRAAVSDLRAAVAEYERDILVGTLETCRYNQRAAAVALSVTYDQLRHCMRRHGLLNRAAS